MSVATRYNSKRQRDMLLRGERPKWLDTHPRAPYLRAAYLSVPPWLDRAELKWLHWCARAWSKAMGVEYVLDHIVPLTHPHVCGLTVPWNMQLVPRTVNGVKSNHWHPDQMALL